MLKFNAEQIIDDYDWDAFVFEIYRKRYAFQQQDECRDRGVFWFNVPSAVVDHEENLPTEIPEVVNGDVMCVQFQSWLTKDSNTYPEHMDTFGRELFWERNFYPSFSTLVNDLYSKGLIEEGRYGINIDW